MRALLAVVLAWSLWLSSGMAQVEALAAEAVPIDVAGAHLPLVSAGTVLRWTPHVDEVLFDLTRASWVRLSVYSPSIDLDEVGDERYDDRPLEATFRLLAGGAADGERLLVQDDFSLASSEWHVLYDGPSDAGRHRIESEVVGHGKNVYLLRLETEIDGTTLYAEQVTVNVSRRDWHPALTFEIDRFARCELGMYDGDGDDELEARLVLPSGDAVRPPVSEDLAWSYQPLPRLLGLYTVQTRIPAQAYQGTNAVRFEVRCAGAPIPLALVPAITLRPPVPGMIVVEVVDLQGRPLDIGYRIEGVAPRVVVLDDDDEHHLVATETEGGEVLAPRRVAFGRVGGVVRYVLDRASAPEPIALPLPAIRSELAPRRLVPQPTPAVVLSPTESDPALLEMGRRVSPPTLVPCQVVDVHVYVRNLANRAVDYTLQEHLPIGIVVETSDGAVLDAATLAWSGRLESGATREHHYRLRLGAGDAESLPLQGVLRWEASTLTDDAAFERRTIRTEFVRRPADGTTFVGDVFEVDALVTNPLDSPLTVHLVPAASSRVALLDGPRTLTLPAAGSATATYTFRGLESGAAALQLEPIACDPGATDEIPAGASARTQWTLEPLPELPAPTLSTSVTVDLSARRLPSLDALVVVARTPDGARYAAGSARLDAEVVADPIVVDGDLVFELEPRSAAQLVYTLQHEVPLAVRDVDHALIALTPRPEVLVGDAAALATYRRATQATGEAVAGEADVVEARDPGAGVAVLAPAPGTVVRDAPAVGVTVAAPVDASVSLFVDDVAVSASRVAQHVRDAGSGRQTLQYVGVPLAPGPNVLRVEASGPDGVAVDERVVHRAGAPATITITPLGPLAADSVEPLRFALEVRDAWGNAPRDSAVTIDVAGTQVAGPDADPQRAGHQIAFRDGGGVLELAPMDRAGVVTVVAAVGFARSEERFTVFAEPRPWIVAGIASFGVAYGPDGLRTGGSGSVFARGAVFGDALLTVALRAPLAPLGQPEGSYERFGVVGSSGASSFDAESRHGAYARLERNDDYLQYGDFVSDFSGAFMRPRSYTGLSGAVASSDGSSGLRAYGAYVAVDDQVEGLELPSDGTSAYRLPGAPLRPGSLRVEVIKRDRADARLLLDDGDALVRALRYPSDFTVDEVLGLVTLARPLPLSDADGNPYVLRASYAVLDLDDARPFVQAGIQASTRLGAATLHAGVAQETRGVDDVERIVAVGGVVDAESGRLALDVAYGQDADAGGLAVAAGVRYAADAIQVEARYRFFGVGFRGAGVTADDQAGHAATLGVTYALLPDLGLRGDLQLRSFTATGDLDVDGRLLASYQGNGALVVGERAVGTRPAAQIGVQFEDQALRGLASLGLRDVFGVAGSDLSVTHLQGLDRDTTSITDLSVALRLADALELRITDRHVWGQGHTLLVGLQSSFENAALVQAACLEGGCDVDEALPLGRSTLIAQYEIPGGVSMDAGRLRLGVDARLPLGERVRLDGSATRVVDRADAARNVTVVAAGLTFDGDTIDAAARYEVRLASEGVKQVATAGVTGALGDALFASVQARFLHDPAMEAPRGLGFSVAAAYRGDRVSALSDHRGRLGSLEAQGDRAFEGDTRLTWTVSRTWELRAGHAYQQLPGSDVAHLASLGLALHPWDGGSVALYGRAFYDRDWVPGVGIEVAQALGCGVYGVAGANLWEGVGMDRGASFARPGVYVRVDVVFDEQWRCGRTAPAGEGP